MSYEATVVAAGGDEATMAKSFVIVAREVARSWYSNLRPGSIHSWADLRSKLKTNFKGVGTNTMNSTEILNCHQGQNEPLREWWRRFIQIKAKTPGISDESVILAAIAESAQGHAIPSYQDVTQKLSPICTTSRKNR